MKNFEYLDPEACYLDSACQTLRPMEVIEAQDEYFKEYNACGDRSKHEWGRKVDEKVSECREAVLDMLGLDKKVYFCAFTLNTTYGINLLLSQIKAHDFQSVVTSEIEHNSVFVPSITYSKKYGWSRKILRRDESGNALYVPEDLDQSVVMLNTSSNLDGRQLGNVKEIIKVAHDRDSVVLLDAAQTLGHDLGFLRGLEFDALFSSAHKAYGASLGIMVIKRSLLDHMDMTFLGGGTVESVAMDSFKLAESEKEPHLAFEPGLQNYSGIIALNKAISWRKDFRPEGMGQNEHAEKLGQIAFDSLQGNPEIKLLNQKPSETLSFYTEKINSHMLAEFLSQQKIMARSGYFCCHYYLMELKKSPPLLRISLGLQNTESGLRTALDKINKIIKNS